MQTNTHRTTSTTGVNPYQSPFQPPAGQFGPFQVEQGQGMPYAQQTAYYPQMMMAYLPFNNQTVAIPAPMLLVMEANITAMVQRAQENNITVALSILQSAVFCFLQFEKAFKSILSSGDDNTQLYNLSKCIDELEQANDSQYKQAISMHPFGYLVTHEDPTITNTRELFEQCIKVIKEFIPCLTGRLTKTHLYEKPIQMYTGWRGWQQQAEQINVSNRALGLLLKKFIDKDENNPTYKEILCFQQSVEYITDCFAQCKYPLPDAIKAIYLNNKCDFITNVEASFHQLDNVTTLEEGRREKEKEESQPSGITAYIPGRDLLSSITSTVLRKTDK